MARTPEQKSNDSTMSLDEAFAAIFSSKCNINWLTAVPKDSDLRTTSLLLDQYGNRGLKELKQWMQTTKNSIAFCLLRWPWPRMTNTDSQCDDAQPAVKFVFGRFVNTGVGHALKQTLSSKLLEIIRPFDVRHLSMDANETAQGWTAENLNLELRRVSQAPNELYLDNVPTALSKWLKHHNVQEKSKKSRGFASKTEARQFGIDYYCDVLRVMSQARSIDMNNKAIRKVINTYFDRNTTQFVGNGCMPCCVDGWLEKHQSFFSRFGPLRSTLERFNIQQYRDFMFVATYSICIDFGGKSSLSNAGTVCMMLNAQRKITHITEVSEPASLLSIQKHAIEAKRLHPSRSCSY